MAHGFLNTFFALWTFGGTVFLLFLGELGLPKRQIGGLLSLFPFCGLLALGVAPVAARWGWKRTFLFGYGTRKGVMALLLLLPWVTRAGGRTTAVAFLVGVIVIFALLRALAETAYYPWVQEFVPSDVRGKVGGISTVLTAVASGLSLAVAGWVVGRGDGLNRFLVLIAGGCVLGLLGVACMARVPGGAPRTGTAGGNGHGDNLALALRDRNFVTYLAALGCTTVGTLSFSSFLPLYVKERLGVASGTVVTLDIAVMAGGALAGLVLGWAADRVGSRPVLMPAAGLAMLVPIGWLLLPRQTSRTVLGCGILYFVNGVAGSGVAIASGRLLYNRVIPARDSTAYTALYYAWMGVAGGLAPLLAGHLLSHCAGWQAALGPVTVDGHAVLFVGAFALLAAACWLYGRLQPDGRHTTRSVLSQMLIPSMRRWLLQVWR